MNKLEEFLMDYPCERTRLNYRTQLNKFFKAINITDPDKYINKRRRDYERDVKAFWLTLNGLPPLSVIAGMSAVKMFLEFHGIDVSKRVWRGLRKKTKGNRARTMDRAPSPFQLKQILSHGSVLENAIFLVASSTGMRIDEIIGLTKDDVDFDSDPMRIDIPVVKDEQDTKSGNPRYCFASNEAKLAVLEWLKERNTRLEVAIRRGRNKRNKDTGKEIFAKVANANQIFPYSYMTVRLKWNRLLRLAGEDLSGKRFDRKDKSTGRYIYHIHGLKKYFLSRMKLELPVPVVEALAGHEGYLDDAYRRYTPEQMGEFYKKGEHLIVVFESSESSEQLISDYAEQQKQIDDLKTQVNKLVECVGAATPAWITMLWNRMSNEERESLKGKMRDMGLVLE